MKKLTSFVVALAVPVFVVAMTAPALAEEQPTLNIHGFGGWAAGYTGNDNLFPDAPQPVATKDGQVDNSYFTLNLLARPVDKVTILAQPTWQSSVRGREVRLDLAYVEVTVAKDLLVRAGKIKNPLGLYTEIYKVGTLRPFYLLPVSYYRLVPESYSGVGVNRRQKLGSWEVELDAFGGQMEIPTSASDMIVGFDQTTMQYQFGSIPVSAQGRKVVGGGMLVRPAVKGLQFGASAYSLKLYASAMGGPFGLVSETRLKAYAGCVEYLTDKISLRSEVLFLRGVEKSSAWYVEAAYYLTNHWQIAATYDNLKVTDPPPPVPQAASLKENHDVGIGLNYWISPKVVWKFNYYHVQDNRASRPDNAIGSAIDGTLKKKTDVLVGGVHFSF
jgi:hypothetical protein